MISSRFRRFARDLYHRLCRDAHRRETFRKNYGVNAFPSFGGSAGASPSRTNCRSACRCLLVVLLLLLMPYEAQAQVERISNELVSAIDRLAEKNGITRETPGLALLIYQPGRLRYAKGYGLANVERKERITQETMFELASVTKTLTATAVLILHDRSKLSIQDDIRKHLPELPDYQPGHPIRIRDLLHHTSGLPDYMSFEGVKSRHRHSYLVNDDFLPLFAEQKAQFSLDFPTGQKYEYNNTNFMLLATIIERVSHDPFAKFMRDELFAPAGMEHTFIYNEPKAAPEHRGPHNHAVGYEWNKDKERWVASWGTPPARHESLLSVGDGGIWTCLDDMFKWDAALRAGKFLKSQTWKLAFSPSKTSDGKTNGYGLGWSVYYDDPKNLYGYGHDGSWGGFRTTYYRYLTADRTTVLLSNRGNFDTDKFWTDLDQTIDKHQGRSKNK